MPGSERFWNELEIIVTRPEKAVKKANLELGMHNRIRILLSMLVLVALSACSTLTSTEKVSVSANQSWILLPINNLSTTPRAGEKTSAMVETHLRARGVQSLQTYATPEGLNLVSLLDTDRQINDAIKWSRDNGIRFGLTGTVHEWHYKSGPDKEPAVGLSLKLIDLSTDEVVWQATTAKTGWGYANVSGVADKAVEKLLKKIKIR